MKKPLILLVDDDPSVLLALEAALRPTFESIVRIETFESGQAVLDAVQGWTDEERPISVAIVDQKMPTMTGVDLLTRLRGATPAEHMQAILLTGYAGLDSAIAAKNEARVQRYLEKPWDPDVLRATVRFAMADHLREAGIDKFLVFREVRGDPEVRAHLALRFRVYRTRGRSAHLVPSESAGFDLDAYDAVSRHFGLFLEGMDDRRLVGTLRVSGREPSPALGSLESLVREFPELTARWSEPRENALPLMKYLIDRDAVVTLVAQIEATGEAVVEPGRLAVAPELYDVLKRASRHLSPHIIESSIAFFFFFFDIKHATLACAAAHVRFYATVGFTDAPGTEHRHHPAFEGVVVCLYANRDGVPEPALSRVLALAARIRRFGGACRCPSFPWCLGGPYETGEFRSVDLFCPSRAVEIVAGHA